MTVIFLSIAFAIFIGAIFGGFYAYQLMTTSPEDRMTVFENSFNRCIQLGVYPDTCEGIAAEASGLAGGGE